MIDIVHEQLVKFAKARFRSGDLEQCHALLGRIPKAQRPIGMFEEVCYALAKQRLALGYWATARDLFAQCAVQSKPGVVASLCQERTTLIHAIERNEVVSAASLKHMWDEAGVQHPCNMPSTQLAPQIAFVGCPAAYRSGYDPGKADALSRLIRMIKHGVDESVIHQLGAYLAAYAFHGTPVMTACDLVIAVPTDRERLTQRGYSIPLILAQEVSRACAIPLHDHLVRTTGKAVELRHVAKSRRADAIAGAFAVGTHADWLAERAVLIVDDVLTTGATVLELARLLSSHGAAEVHVIALAHTEWSAI